MKIFCKFPSVNIKNNFCEWMQQNREHEQTKDLKAIFSMFRFQIYPNKPDIN